LFGTIRETWQAIGGYFDELRRGRITVQDDRPTLIGRQTAGLLFVRGNAVERRLCLGG